MEVHPLKNTSLGIKYKRLVSSSYRKMKLVENLTAFANETSIHGLIYIAKSPSKAVRIAWFFIFTAALMYAFVRISYDAKCK